MRRFSDPNANSIKAYFPCFDAEFLSLYRPCDNTLDDVPLAEKVKHYYWYNGKHKHCHKSAPVDRAVCALHCYLYCYRQGLVSAAEYQVGEQIIVPYPHGVQNGNGYGCGLEDRENYPV